MDVKTDVSVAPTPYLRFMFMRVDAMLPGSFPLEVFSQQIFENQPHQILMYIREMINKA